MSVEPRPTKLDPEAYVALHRAFDEPAADAALSPRERELRRPRAHCRRERRCSSGRARSTQLMPSRTTASRHWHALGCAGSSSRGPRAAPLIPTSPTRSSMEEIAAACAATSLVFMTQMHAAYPILLAGSEELQTAIHPRPARRIAATGRWPSPSPTPAPTSPACDHRGNSRRRRWSLSGQKTFITTGDRADVIVCFATVDRDSGPARESPPSSSKATGTESAAAGRSTRWGCTARARPSSSSTTSISHGEPAR